MSPFHEFLIRGFTRDISSPMMSQLIARPRGGIGLQILRNWFNIFRTGRFADKDVVFDLQRISKQINFVYGENDFLTNVAALKSLKAGRRTGDCMRFMRLKDLVTWISFWSPTSYFPALFLFSMALNFETLLILLPTQ